MFIDNEQLDLLNRSILFDFSLVTAFRVIENVSEKYLEEGFGAETTQENESTTQKLPRNYPETDGVSQETSKKHPRNR